MIVNFAKYNPPLRFVAPTQRGDATLQWVRWNADTHRNVDLLDLPKAERWIWPVLLGLAVNSTTRGTVLMTPAHLAREADLTEEEVTHALNHLWRRGLVRFTKGGARHVSVTPAVTTRHDERDSTVTTRRDDTNETNETRRDGRTLELLEGVPGWIIDPAKDDALLAALAGEYPALDPARIVRDLATWALDNPLGKNPRMRLRTFFRKAEEWRRERPSPTVLRGSMDDQLRAIDDAAKRPA